MSQMQSKNWHFGLGSSISFVNGIPIVQTDSKISAPEGSATISDKNGKLLFYTDGVTIWSKSNQVMANGTGLFGDPSSTQSAIIIPQPHNDSIFIVFTVDKEGGPNGICYSIVNINKSNGLGEVTQKNIPLINSVAEKLTAVRHCNNKDVWVLARGWNSDRFYAWLVTSNGVNPSPIISFSGNFLSGDPRMSIGYMKASPDGKKIAAAHLTPNSFTEIGDFNSENGTVSNIIKIPALPPEKQQYYLVGQAGTYGIEFSPDSKLLYTSVEYFPYNGNPYISQDTWFIFQLAISNSDSTMIHNSMTRIDSSNSAQSGAMQLGPDNKIYITHGARNYLSVINNPNLSGQSCGFQRNVITLTGNGGLGLPSFIQSYFGDNIYNYTFNNNCSSQKVDFQINNTDGYNSIKWDFGDIQSGPNNTSNLSNPVHTFTSFGSYDVMLIIFRNSNHCAIPDTIKKTIWVGNMQNILAADTTICERDTIKLQISPINEARYLWNDNSTTNEITISTPGDYWLQITARSCVYSDTIHVSQRSLPRFTLGNDTTFCGTQNITLQPVQQTLNGSYLWSTNVTNTSIIVSSPGTYWLRGNDELGCAWVDTITITAMQLPTFFLGNDTAICEQQKLQLNTHVPNATYLWNTGDTTRTLLVDSQNLYWADVTKEGCRFRDSIYVSIKPLPIVDLGKDTILCVGQLLSLNVFNSGATYKWQDNSNQFLFAVNKAGYYHVAVNMNGCGKNDSVKVDYTQKPEFTLGIDKTICSGEVIQLAPISANLAGTRALWQDGSTTLSFNANKEGLYILNLTNNCGTATDSIFLNEDLCQLYVPNVFTPNGDHLNDFFKILNTQNLVEFHLQIFDRWGNKVFETNDRLKSWDGRFKGTEAPVGTFAYTLTYRQQNGNATTHRKGTIKLIR